MPTPWDEEMQRPKRRPRAKAPPSYPDTKPVLRISTEISATTDLAIAALGADLETYQRDHKLVHVTRDTERGGAGVIRPMAMASIADRLSAVVHFEKYDKRSGEYEPATPPPSVVGAVMSRGVYPGVRSLVGVVDTPLVRADGSIVEAPGFDGVSGYLYAPQMPFPPIPKCPTEAEARAAAAALFELVHDFPFAGQSTKGEPNCNRSAWLALLLTVLVRPAIAGCVPAYGITANIRAAGKGKLVSIPGTIALGTPPALRPLPEGDAEMRKALTGIFRDGETFVAWDNAADVIGWPSLDAALTTMRWDDRALGSNDSVRADNVATQAFTGNGLTYQRDTARRIIPITLESLDENPENRTDFKIEGDLLAHVVKRRTEYVVAALTIVRAWFAAGKPDRNPVRLGSFEAWSAIVPAIVRWLGEPCPLLARADLDAADESRNSLAALLEYWSQVATVNGGSLTCGQVIKLLYPPPTRGDAPPETETIVEFRAALESLVGKAKPNSMEVAHALRVLKGRVIGGRRLTSVTKQGTARWSVETIRGVREVRGVPSLHSREVSGGHFGAPGETDPTKSTYPTDPEAA